MKENSLVLLLITFAVFLGLTLYSFVPNTNSLGGSYTDTFSDATTNTSSSVAGSSGSTKSQVIAENTVRVYARVTNLSAQNVTCYLDNDTAASSVVTPGAGLMLWSISSSTQPHYIEFGTCQTCIPYKGAVNCVATATSTVGIIEK